MILSAACIALLAGTEKIKLALVPFDDSITAESEADKAGDAISGALEKNLSTMEHIVLRERGAIQSYIDRLILAQAGLSGADPLKEKSDLLKINYLIVGSISKIDGAYEVDTRAVNVDTWQIVQSHGCTVSNINAALPAVTEEIRDNLVWENIKEREKENPGETRPCISVENFRDFSIQNLPESISGAIPELLNSEMGMYGGMHVIERKYCKALINEKIFEMMGVIENTDSDEILSDIGIKYLVKGDVRSFRDVTCVNYCIHDTSDGRVVFMGSYDITSNRILRPLSKTMALTINDVLNNRLATLKLTSDPQGAEVFIDDDLSGKTPLVIGLDSGTHQVKVKLTGYKIADISLKIKPKTVAVKNVELEKLSTRLLMDGMTMERKGDWNSAVAVYNSFIEQYGESPEVNQAYYRKGHIEMMNLKKPADALKTFQLLVNRYPDAMTRAEAYFAMARAYNTLGRKTEARATLKYIIDHYADTPAAEEAKVAEWNTGD